LVSNCYSLNLSFDVEPVAAQATPCRGDPLAALDSPAAIANMRVQAPPPSML